MNDQNMYQELESQLKTDARAIQAQAEARLADVAFQQRLQASLNQPQPVRRFNRLAVAAMVLLAGSWLLLDQTSHTSSEAEPPLLAQQHSPLWKLAPNTAMVEQAIHQPLLKEQQAIINDLKSLRVQLISI